MEFNRLTFALDLARLLPSEKTQKVLGVAVPTVTLNPEGGSVFLKAELRHPVKPAAC